MTALFLFAAMLGPQQAPSAQEPARIRVTTRMVEVGVVVQDQNGRPIKDLRVEDFQLFDGETEEPIRSFQGATGGTRERAAQPGQARVSTAILLDYFNTGFEDEAFGRTELLHYLRSLEPNQPLALLKLDLGFRVLHDFTTDAASLARALEQHRPYRPIYARSFRPFRSIGTAPRGSGAGGSGQMPYDPDAAGRDIDVMMEAAKAAARARDTISAVAALSGYLASVPGRKNLIWVSSEFPGALSAAVRGDDVAVYPVDVRRIEMRARITDPVAPEARILAERTGGVAFDHGNSVKLGIVQAMESGAATYLLGYYPSHQQWNGLYRPIRVAIRREGAVARYRPGYVAVLEESAHPEEDEKILREVAGAAAEHAAIPVQARVQRQKDGTRALAIAVDGRALQLTPLANMQQPDLELLVLPQRADGSSLEADYCTVVIDPGKGRAKYLREPVTTIRPFPSAADAHQVRVVVRDPRTGALGSATVLLKPQP